MLNSECERVKNSLESDNDFSIKRARERVREGEREGEKNTPRRKWAVVDGGHSAGSGAHSQGWP